MSKPIVRVALALVLTAGALLATNAAAQAATPSEALNWAAPTVNDPVASPTGISCVQEPAPRTAFNACLSVDTKGYVTQAEITAFSNSYSLSRTLLDRVAPLTAVTCASQSFCVAADAAGGVYSDVQGAWTARSVIDAGHAIVAASCPSTTFCMFIDSSGAVVTGTGHPLARTPLASTSLDGLSCVSSTFCKVVDGAGKAFTYNGATWSSGVAMDSAGAPTSVSCATTTFCIAVDDQGNAVTFDGTTWSAPLSIAASAQITSVSCSATNYCAAVTRADTGLFFNGATWATQDDIVTWLDAPNNSSDPEPVLAVGCATLCLAADSMNDFGTFNGVSWAQIRSEYLASAVRPSCASATFCAATDAYGEVLFYRDGTWSSPAYISVRPLTVGDCVSDTFCVFYDSNDIYTWNGTSLSAPFVAYGTNGVSCRSTTFCIAINAGGMFSRYNGTTWSTPTEIDSTGQSLYSVSCTARTFCMATDVYERWLIYNGSTWSLSSDRISPQPTGRVTCASATLCLVSGPLGYVMTWDGTSWSPTLLAAAPSGAVYDVNCVRATKFCVAADSFDGVYNALTSRGGTWSAPKAVGYLNDIDCPTTLFCMAQDGRIGTPA